MNVIRVKDWDRFQHYKKGRTPPWIKLYNDLLDNYDFARLQDASKMHLVGIWLLASRLENKVPADAAWVAQKIGATEPVDLDTLVNAGFITISSPLADGLQDASNVLPLARACVEGEAEAYTEEEKRGERTHTHAHEVDEFTTNAVRGLYGYAGSEGTDPVLVKAFEGSAERDRCLDIALARFASERKPYNARFFRAILQTVIAEQSGPGDPFAGTALALTHDERVVS